MEGKEPRPMKEIHEIRLRLYEEDKGLSPEERIKKTRKFLREIIENITISLKSVILWYKFPFIIFYILCFGQDRYAQLS